MKVFPFRAWRPPPALVERVSSVPYDVVDLAEARALAADNPSSFLRVTRPDIDLPDDASAEAQVEQAIRQFENFRSNGFLAQDPLPQFYAYEQCMGSNSQTGIVACCHADDYDAGVIRKHEHTRPDKEEDRVRHIHALGAHTGPVFLTYPDVEEIDAVVESWKRADPLYDFAADDGVRHRVWPGATPASITRSFAQLAHCYIADGHHRAAGAARVAALRRGAGRGDGDGAESDRFLSVLFPASQLQVLAYNRVVRDLNGLDTGEFIRAAGDFLEIRPDASPRPSGPRIISMYLGGAWYRLSWSFTPQDAVAALDVSILQDHLLGPLLGIDDPRTSSRIEFVGGIRGPGELAARVDSGRAAVAFSMFPTTVEQLMCVSDAGEVMPPKSTWFEPKLRSGLFVHEF